MNKYMDLSPTQKKILYYIEEHINSFGKIPSLREAANDNNVSHAAIAQTINALEKKGYIRRDGKYSRTLHILDKPIDPARVMNTIEIPIIGNIAAGMPLYAQQEWDGTIVVDSSMYTGDNLFALIINGDSMKDAAILDGDLVICEPRQFAENGEIVVALINNEDATVKRFFLKRKKIVLQPENTEYKPVSYDFGEVLIQGKVVGVIRGPGAFKK
jgi:repressor LexA